MISPGGSSGQYREGVRVAVDTLDFIAQLSKSPVVRVFVSEENHRQVLLHLQYALQARQLLGLDYEIVLHNRKQGAIPTGFDRCASEIASECH